jgi:DNA primase
MLPYDEWLDQAQALALGRSKRVKHCNHNTTMKISHDEEGYHAYCFRCSEGGFKGHGIQRIRDVFAEKEFQYAKVPRVPDDFTLDVPDSAAVWYYSYGISASLARSYGIGYSKSLDRVILPVYVDDCLAVVQARAVRKGMQPKYLNQSGNKKGSVLFRSHNQGGDTVCVTEDILSCVRVGEVIPAVCPMGTSLSDTQAAQLLDYKTVLIWLDNDQAGWKGASRMHKALSMVMQSRIIKMDYDPKCYNQEQIKEITDDALTKGFNDELDHLN